MTTRRGRPIRRAMAVAATASGGATTAPSANAAANGTGSSHHVTRPTPSAVKITSPTERNADGAAVLLEVDQGAADRGGVQQRWQQPHQHHLGGQVHLGDERQERGHHADQRQQQRRGQVEPARQPRHRRDGGEESEGGDGDRHQEKFRSTTAPVVPPERRQPRTAVRRVSRPTPPTSSARRWNALMSNASPSAGRGPRRAAAARSARRSCTTAPARASRGSGRARSAGSPRPCWRARTGTATPCRRSTRRRPPRRVPRSRSGTPMSSTTRAARSDWPSSRPIRLPGSSM